MLDQIGLRPLLIAALGMGILVPGLTGCDAFSDSASSQNNRSSSGANCGIASTSLTEGGSVRDGIPALTNPPIVDADDPAASYLADTSRVVGLIRGGEPLAVPHNILWHHEIVNIDGWGQDSIAVSYCPLTGSSLVFDRSAVDGAEFGVSGLLLDNNLVLYDRRENESLWPQMSRASACGPASGTELEMIPATDVRWGEWRTLHPDTDVLSDQTGYDKNYTPNGNPYRLYQRHDDLFFDVEIDDRRPVKERVLGIAQGDGGIAFPFGALDEQGPVSVAESNVGSTKIVVFWHRSARGAVAFQRRLNGTVLSFSVEGDEIVDQETGSRWRFDGTAVDGPRAGQSLKPVRRAHVAYWFAWARFHPDTNVWRPAD